jgi:hypothetical protein
VTQDAFRVGELVRWTSSSPGAVLRVGVVVAVVPAGAAVADCTPAGRWSRRFDSEAVRASESYLVALKQGGSGPGILHRPWVSRMRRFSDGPDAPATRPVRAVAPRGRPAAPVAAAESARGVLRRLWQRLVASARALSPRRHHEVRVQQAVERGDVRV